MSFWLISQYDRPTRDPWDSLSWWRNEDQARRIETHHNREHPEHQIRVQVVDTFAANDTVDHIFNYGLLIIPSLFLLSAALWCLSRFFLKSSLSWYLESAALLVVSVAFVSFVVFGLIFFIGMCSGYKFEYFSIDNNVYADNTNYTMTIPLNDNHCGSNQSLNGVNVN